MSEKVALVTGAARGIGLATTQRFLRVTKVAQGLNAAMPIVADVSEPDQVSDYIGETEKHFGRLDALVNNAGVADFGPIAETTFERWRTIMATNLDGVFLTSQASIPLMQATGGGAIVNIASISGRLRHLEGCCHSTHAATSSGARGDWYSGQRCCPRPRRDKTGHGRAHAGDHRRLSRRVTAQPLWERRRDCERNMVLMLR